MKKNLIVLFLVFALTQNVFAATIFNQYFKYGLKNDSGEIILPAHYDKIEQLQYTPVKTVLIPMQATNEKEVIKLDKYKVKQNNHWGVVNNEGKILCSVQYDDVNVNEYGEISLTANGETTLLNPVKNSVKTTTKTVESIIGLPVTILAGVMMPVEIISKIGRQSK